MTSSVTRLVINGAAGRMGRRLIALGADDQELQIVAALESEQHPELRRDAGELSYGRTLGVPLSGELNVEADAAIDFSVPQGAERITALCVEKKLPLVLATTGLTEGQLKKVRAASEAIPLVMAPSMSLAVNLAMKLCETAGRALSQRGETDVEIIERHHHFKEDAPSGTALKFGEVIASQMGQTKHVHGRQGRPGARAADEIGYHALRVGDNPGEHTIVFGMIGETLEMTVRATTRDSYAAGALAAAKWVARQAPGLYNMNDVLGL